MKYTGVVRNGVVVLEGDKRPPEGTRVVVEELDEESLPSLAERLGNLIGSIDDLPADMAEQHDKYIHGKQE